MTNELKVRSLEEIEKEIESVKKELSDLHGTETEVYARIVGYYRAVKNWNKGKRDEFDSRKAFCIKEGTCERSESEMKEDGVVSSVKNDFSFSKASSSEKAEKATHFEEKSELYRYELFAKKTCPNCPPVKSFMENIPLPGSYIDVDTDEGLSEAASKGVFASPTVIVYDSEDNEIARGHNVEELELIFDKVLVKETV